MNSQKRAFHFKSAPLPTGTTAEQAEVLKVEKKWAVNDKGAFKRPSFEAALPALEVSDIANILATTGDGQALILDTLNELFYTAARAKLNEVIAAAPLEDVDLAIFDGITWESISSGYLAAATETRSSGITKEDLDSFEADYVEVMLPLHASRGEAKVRAAAAHLRDKFAKCRSNPQGIEILQGFLAQWFAATPNAAQFARVYDMLDKRATAYLAPVDLDI